MHFQLPLLCYCSVSYSSHRVLKAHILLNLGLFCVSEVHSTHCRYPAWVTEHHHWHTLDVKRSYQFSHKNATLRISNDSDSENAGKELRVVCHSILESAEKQVTLTAHVTVGWYVYICVLCAPSIIRGSHGGALVISHLISALQSRALISPPEAGALCRRA
jgi:hypothetical protein